MYKLEQLRTSWIYYSSCKEAAKFDKGAAAAAYGGAATLEALVKNLTNLTAAKT
jgi:hypothetical protein